jgi:hypothetical protein
VLTESDGHPDWPPDLRALLCSAHSYATGRDQVTKANRNSRISSFRLRSVTNPTRTQPTPPAMPAVHGLRTACGKAVPRRVAPPDQSSYPPVASAEPKERCGSSTQSPPARSSKRFTSLRWPRLSGSRPWGAPHTTYGAGGGYPELI